MTGNRNLVLGLGGCVDFEIVWDTQTISKLAIAYDIGLSNLDICIPVMDERSLLISILSFMNDSAGGERFIASADISTAFAARFAYKISLGGTCVRAAIVISKLGIPSTVHLVSIDDNVRHLLPSNVDQLCSASTDSTYPHLIVQFPADTTIELHDGKITSKYPNRIIYVNDPPNQELVLASDLGDVLADATAFLISGFNAMRDPALLRDRLFLLRNAMTNLPPHALVFYEDADFHATEIRQIVKKESGDRINIHSLNEDELQSYLRRQVNLLDATDVASALTEFRHYGVAPVTVLHTKYWALAYGNQASVLENALLGGVDLASTRYCYGDDFSSAELAEIQQRPFQLAGTVFAKQISKQLGENVRCVSSRLLDAQMPTTVGLGDTFVGGFLATLVHDQLDKPSLEGPLS